MSERKPPMTVSELIDVLVRCDGDALVCESNQFGFMTISRVTTRDDEAVLDEVEGAPYLTPRIVVLE